MIGFASFFCVCFGFLSCSVSIEANKRITDLVRNGKNAEAIVSANDCLSKLGDSSLLYYARGMARLQSSKLADAESDFSKALDCKDATEALKIDILINRGATRKLSNQFAAALTYAQNQLSVCRFFFFFLFNRSVAITMKCRNALRPTNRNRNSREQQSC